MDTATLTPVVRPNGKTYRPRKPPETISFSDDDSEDWVCVLRTHNLDAARRMARPFSAGYLSAGQEAWLRCAMRRGEQYWEYDDVRGVPAIMFMETDERPDDPILGSEP